MNRTSTVTLRTVQQVENKIWIGAMESNLMTHTRQSDVHAEQVLDLFETYHESIFAYLYRLLGDAEWAHDLTQDTFLRLFETRERLSGVENQRAWTYRIASNMALNALKRRRRFRWLPWRDDDVLQGEAQLIQASVAGAVEVEQEVSRALAAMTPEYRAPLLLYSQFDFSVREVADMLGLSESAVKTRLFRAREMFRKAYKKAQISDEV